MSDHQGTKDEGVNVVSYDNVNFVCGIQHCQFSLSFSGGLWSCEWKTRLKKHICNSVPVESKCFNETLEMQHHPMRCIGLDLLAVLGRRMPGPLKMKMAVIGMEMRWQRQKKRMQIARFFPACMLGPHCCPVHKCSRYMVLYPSFTLFTFHYLAFVSHDSFLYLSEVVKHDNSSSIFQTTTMYTLHQE